MSSSPFGQPAAIRLRVGQEIDRSIKKCLKLKHKRSKRQFEQKFKSHPVTTPKGQKSQPIDSGQKISRGWYFKAYRRERLVLSNLARSLPCLDEHRENRRALRAVYYRLLPVLSRLLTLDRDQKVLKRVARDYATALNIIAMSRNQSGGTSVRSLWSILRITPQAETRPAEAAAAAWQKLY